ncbi:MAG: polymer-forming cytoskeletal protein [Pseudomonadota bacterium]
MARNKFQKGVTLIANHTEMKGDVIFKDQFFVAGKISGNIQAEGDKATLIVSEEGFVSGEIRVPNVVISGTIEGNVYASHKVELSNQSKVKGSIYYKLIEMQLGALVDGQLVHDENLGTQPNVHPLKTDIGE